MIPKGGRKKRKAGLENVLKCRMSSNRIINLEKNLFKATFPLAKVGTITLATMTRDSNMPYWPWPPWAA